ncbi:tRNA adenosine(34) deaminase TadA [Fundicoccus sp. Sow4_H7]|uniref:tRNA adenosine(34) deaminase TadA n=1 Tax=Fundicoccus sp. Sow4_H7 TaxID=3438784 RepID=UPI003F9350BB
MRQEDEFWMQRALEEASKAAAIGEVPIGAVIVKDGELIATGYNLREVNRAALAHAEIVAIQAANEALDAWRLEGATLYVTLEPCPMCAGAMIMSRISRVVYGASDPKAGCAGSLMNLLADDRFNHQPEVTAGILAAESSLMLKNFFKALRQRNKSKK